MVVIKFGKDGKFLGWRGKSLDVDLCTYGVTPDEACDEVRRICEIVEEDLIITFGKSHDTSYNAWQSLTKFSEAVIGGYKENPHKEDVVFSVHANVSFIVSSTNWESRTLDTINDQILAERKKTRTFHSKLAQALRETPFSPCREGATQTKDGQLFLGKLSNFVDSLQFTSENKTNLEVFSEIENYVQMLKEPKEEEEIFYVTDANYKTMSITRCFEKMVVECDAYDAQENADALYKTRKFQKCKLGAVYELVAIFLDRDIIRSEAIRLLCGKVIMAFQHGDGGDYPHINEIFKTILAENNFHF